MARERRGGRQVTPSDWAKRNNATLHLPGDGTRPSFGYFPNARSRTSFARLEPQAPLYEYAVEVRLGEHAVLAYEYRPDAESAAGSASTGYMVQIWTPPVPALTFDTSLKSMVSSLKGRPNAFQAPGTVTTGHSGFDAKFTVYCEHPAFARGVLTPPLLQWLLTDPRTPRGFGLLNSVALESGQRRLPLDDVLATAGFLIDLVRAMPPYTWRYRP
jgi:hypothetical protein